MCRKTIWISIRRLKLHEFHSTLRIVGKSTDWPTTFARLSELQKNAISSFLKTISPLLFAYLALSSLNSGAEISLTIQTITASIPTAYFAVVCSFGYLLATLSLIHLLMIMTVRAKWFGKAIVPGFSPTMYGLLNNYDEVAMALPIVLNQFFREKLHISSILTSLLSLALIAMVIPFIALGWYLILTQVNVISSENAQLFERMASFFGIAILVFSGLYAILFHLPLPMEKNTYGIRFGFLCAISPFFPHPRTEHWLKGDT